MMKTTVLLAFIVFLALVSDSGAKKLSRSRSSGSGRGSGRKTNSQPAPTSFSYPQSSAQKPSLFGWQEKPAQKPSNQGHSYPSSHTGLSGNNQPKQSPSHQENIQKSYVPVQQSAPQQNNHAGQSYPVSNGLSGSSSGSGYPQPKQPPIHQESIQRSSVQQSAPQSQQHGHSYPVSNGLSGSSGSGAGYPQGQGLSGHNAAPPPYPGTNTANYNKPQGAYPNANAGNNYNHAAPPPYASGGNGYHPHPQGPPPPYTSGHGYGGGNGVPGSYSPQAPGYFGNYANNGRGFGSVSRTRSALTGVGIAGAGIGTVLTGLALWNLARSTGHRHHTVIYDNRGQPIAVAPDNGTAPAVDPILGDLVNCTLTIDSENSTEVIAIPCSIATSFTPEADVKDAGINNQTNDKTKCTVTVVTKTGKEFMTTIPCSVLLNTAAENNVTEPPILDGSLKIENGTLPNNDTLIYSDQPTALRLSTTNETPKNEETNLNCTTEEGEIRDPINPCFSVQHNLTVIPLHTTEHIMQT